LKLVLEAILRRKLRNPPLRILGRVSMRYFRPLQKLGGNLEVKKAESSPTDFVHTHGFFHFEQKKLLERRFEGLKLF